MEGNTFFNSELPFAISEIQYFLSLQGLPIDTKLTGQINCLLNDAWQLSSVTFNINDAVTWAGNFRFPNNIGERDLQDLRKYGSLQRLCTARHDVVRGKKLNVTRVENVISADRMKSFNVGQDKQRAMQIAQFGMSIPTSRSFVACNTPPPLRRKYLKVQAAVNKIIFAMYEKGQTVLLLPTDEAKKIPGIHFSATHWTTKKNKSSGRILGDQSNDPNDNNLNDGAGESQQLVTELWGNIVHPTLNDLAVMINTQATLHGWESIILWKMDLQGAFSLLRINPIDVPKFAFELTDNLTLIHTAGMFGWTGTPFAFAVFSRLLQGCIQHDIEGDVKVYVDDLCGCSASKHNKTDQLKAADICTGLLGDDALALDKQEEGRRLDMIGWSFDLDLRTVSVSYNNHLKTIFCVFQFKHGEKYHLIAWQTLAARASRYVAVCPHMKPFTSAFHRMSSSYQNNNSIMKLTSTEAWRDLRMWKVFLCLLLPYEKTLARSLNTFQAEPPSIRIEYDASLTGAGFVISKQAGKTGSWTILAHAGLVFPFADVSKMDSSYQNSCEFIAVVLALYFLCRSGIVDFAYELIGDSVSSLIWCQKGTAKSPFAHRASIAFSLLCIKGNFRMQQYQHIPGVENKTCDALSRGIPSAQLLLPPESAACDTRLSEFQQLLILINPCLKQDQDLDYHRDICEFIQTSIQTNPAML